MALALIIEGVLDIADKTNAKAIGYRLRYCIGDYFQDDWTVGRKSQARPMRLPRLHPHREKQGTHGRVISMTTSENLISELEISELKRLRLKRQSLLEECEPEDASLWAMLDIMTLILAFFIMLYSSQAHMPQALEIKHVPTEVRQPVESVKTPVKPAKKKSRIRAGSSHH